MDTKSERHVLIVDDDDDIRTVLRGVYERADFVVHLAPEGRTAMRILFEQPIDLVVLDLGLPYLDGMEVLARIREMTDLPVMLLTARAREDDKVTGLMTGADDYLTKPFSNRELIAEASRCFAEQRRAALLRKCSTMACCGSTTNAGRCGCRASRWRSHRTTGTCSSRSHNVPTGCCLRSNCSRSPGTTRWASAPSGSSSQCSRLRRRLGWDDAATSPIQAVRGFGYRYRPTAPAGDSGRAGQLTRPVAAGLLAAPR